MFNVTFPFPCVQTVSSYIMCVFKAFVGNVLYDRYTGYFLIEGHSVFVL